MLRSLTLPVLYRWSKFKSLTLPVWIILFRRHISRRNPAVDQKICSRDVRRFVRSQEQRRPRDLLRFAEAPHRNVYQSPPLLLFGVQVAHQQFGPQRPGAERVAPDVFARVDDGQIARQGVQGSLSRGVRAWG